MPRYFFIKLQKMKFVFHATDAADRDYVEKYFWNIPADDCNENTSFYS